MLGNIQEPLSKFKEEETSIQTQFSVVYDSVIGAKNCSEKINNFILKINKESLLPPMQNIVGDLQTFIELICPKIQNSLNFVKLYFIEIQNLSEICDCVNFVSSHESEKNFDEFNNTIKIMDITIKNSMLRKIEIFDFEKKISTEKKRTENKINNTTDRLNLEIDQIKSTREVGGFLFKFVALFKDISEVAKELENQLKQLKLKQIEVETIIDMSKSHNEAFSDFESKLTKLFISFQKLKTQIGSVIDRILESDLEEKAELIVLLKIVKIQSKNVISVINKNDLLKGDKYESVKQILKTSKINNINFQSPLYNDIQKANLFLFSLVNFFNAPQEKDIPIFEDSKILKNKDDIAFLKSMFSKIEATFLLFSGSDDPTKFHKVCDNKTKTVLIAQVGDNISGGYNPIGWAGDTVFTSEEAFLFSIKNKKKYSIKNKMFAIDNHPNDGPIFGFNPQKIQICPKCGCYLHDLRIILANKSFNCHSKLVNYGDQSTNELELFGKSCFRVDAWEVYMIIFK